MVDLLRRAISISNFLTTKEEIASNFKAQGNDYFKAKRYREALGFYTQAIDAKPTDPVLKESLFLNRAACNLELSEWRDVPFQDCTQNEQRISALFYAIALAFSPPTQHPSKLSTDQLWHSLPLKGLMKLSIAVTEHWQLMRKIRA
jgi:tetratricopeptide (TPR) repeat protein